MSASKSVNPLCLRSVFCKSQVTRTEAGMLVEALGEMNQAAAGCRVGKETCALEYTSISVLYADITCSANKLGVVL